MRRKEATIELHPFDNFDVGFAATAFFNRDHTIFANLDEGVGKHITDCGIVITGDRRDLLNLFLAFR